MREEIRQLMLKGMPKEIDWLDFHTSMEDADITQELYEALEDEELSVEETVMVLHGIWELDGCGFLGTLSSVLGDNVEAANNMVAKANRRCALLTVDIKPELDGDLPMDFESGAPHPPLPEGDDLRSTWLSIPAMVLSSSDFRHVLSLLSGSEYEECSGEVRERIMDILRTNIAVRHKGWFSDGDLFVLNDLWYHFVEEDIAYATEGVDQGVTFPPRLRPELPPLQELVVLGFPQTWDEVVGGRNGLEFAEFTHRITEYCQQQLSMDEVVALVMTLPGDADLDGVYERTVGEAVLRAPKETREFVMRMNRPSAVLDTIKFRIAQQADLVITLESGSVFDTAVFSADPTGWYAQLEQVLYPDADFRFLMALLPPMEAFTPAQQEHVLKLLRKNIEDDTEEEASLVHRREWYMPHERDTLQVWSELLDEADWDALFQDPDSPTTADDSGDTNTKPDKPFALPLEFVERLRRLGYDLGR